MLLQTFSLPIIFLLVFSGAANAEELRGKASVIDGDTIEIHGERIRLHAIDSPEGRQRCTKGGKEWRCGTEAARALDAFIDGTTVSCEPATATGMGGSSLCAASERQIWASGWCARAGRWPTGATGRITSLQRKPHGRTRPASGPGRSVAVSEDDDVTSNKVVRQLEDRVRELERQLGRKTLEAEILREALDKSRSKPTLLARSPLKDDFR